MATELEMLERAKAYMEKLANGIDPISDTEARDDDCINNVRLSRCFFYVADVLQKVIDNGGVIAPVKKKAGTIPFAITGEELDRFEFSDNPIALSEIAKRINALTNNENMKKLTYNHLADWLMGIDMLEYAQKGDGSTTKYPTEKGKYMVIAIEKRQSMRGEYLTVVYNKQAQQFIIDNMDAVVDSIGKK